MYTGFSSLSSLFVAWMSPVFSLIMKRSPAPSPERIYLSDPSPLSWSECSWWWNENNQEGGKINNWDTILHISSHYHDAGLLIPSQKAVHFFQEIRWYLSRRTEWMEWWIWSCFQYYKKNLWGNLGTGVADDFPKLSIYRSNLNNRGLSVILWIYRIVISNSWKICRITNCSQRKKK